ncbi:hypothetical protein [Morganella morganii]|uniref:hypothetical protein n=1 Tax=Morganella morganii TaxID=582 RepID=UPI000C7B3423|nr:hypothetical protein [Morganella morganii]PLA34339.1 hypothetical protein CYJ97_07230 [Morganella morganii]QPJ67494.1 hypothetical protein IR188_12570 [Morganella morganii]
MIAIISLIVSITSLLISIGTFFAAYRRDKNALGVSEENTYSRIQDAEDTRADYSMEIALKAEEWEQVNTPQKYAMSVAECKMADHKIERVLNAYDIACQRYIDNKLDRKRFSRTYGKRIEEVCNNPDFRRIKDRTTHKYTALGNVNDMLNNPEKK